MRFYLDKRSVGRDGRCALRLRMSKDGETAMPLTGIPAVPPANIRSSVFTRVFPSIYKNLEGVSVQLRPFQ